MDRQTHKEKDRRKQSKPGTGTGRQKKTNKERQTERSADRHTQKNTVKKNELCSMAKIDYDNSKNRQITKETNRQIYT